jgi:2-isopropylmalate synthase
MVWNNDQENSSSEATIKMEVPQDIQQYRGIVEPMEHMSADGNGPVEALDRALRRVLERFYPQLKEVKLADYKVRILDEEDGTRAITRVLIHSMDSKMNSWSTVGVSGNIIDASWQALTDSLIFKLVKDEEKLFNPDLRGTFNSGNVGKGTEDGKIN